MKYLILVFSSIFFLTVKSPAQFVVERINDVEVLRENGLAYANPWVGGLNAVEPSKFDADYDGEEDDLFIFDKAGNRTLVFIGDMIDGEIYYEFDPDRSNDFPSMRNFALLRDFDCDGKRDLFTYSPLGGAMSVWRNIGNAAEGIQWEQETDAILSFFDFGTTSFTTNIYTSPLDIPAIFDYDGDGDLDIMSFNVGGTFIELHLNNSVENTGNCGFDLYLANRCYGGFLEGENSNSISLDPVEFEEECSFNVPDPKSNTGLRHVGSTILAFDANADNLVDLVLGDVGFTNLVYLENSSPPDAPNQIVDFSITFPEGFGGVATDINNFPAAFYEDVDGDGISDLLVSVNSVAGVDSKESFYVYLNEGSENLPEFTLVTEAFLQNEMLEFGERTKPAIYDYNGDGLPDIVVGSRGEFLGEGNFDTHLILIENTGTASNPSFQIVDSDWLNIGDLFSERAPNPDFADWDGDGDEDLILGTQEGVLKYFENDGSFIFEGNVQANGSDIDVGNFSAPSHYDIDGDGKIDLIVGEADGNLNYFRNTSSGSNLSFELITENLGNIDVTALPFFEGESNPVFYEFQGSSYLACGTKSGRIDQFEIGEDPFATWSGFDGEGFGAYPDPDSSPAGLSLGLAIRDLDGDALPEIIVGHIGGGLEYYIGEGFLSNSEVRQNIELKLYPNPAEDFFQISNDFDDQRITGLELTDISGREVLSVERINQRIDISSLPRGVYVVKISLSSGIVVSEKLVVK